MAQTKHLWTVGIIMMHDGGTFFEYTDLEQSIYNQQKYESVRYVLFHYDQPSKLATIKQLEREKDGVYRFVRKKGPFPCDFYRRQDIVDFLHDYVRNKTPDPEIEHHIMVITYGHAAGLGFFAQRSEEKHIDYFDGYDLNQFDLTEEQRVFLNRLFNVYAFAKANTSSRMSTEDLWNIVSSRFEKRLSSVLLNLIQERLQLITAKDMDEIFRRGLSDQQIDVFLTINCYTQMFETGCAFMKTVKMLVSPETTIPFAGINYTELFSLLEKNPAADLAVIGNNIATLFHDKYRTEPFRSIFLRRYPVFVRKIEEVSIAANLPKYYQEIYAIVDVIAQNFYKYCKLNINGSNPDYDRVIKQKIIDARRASGDVTIDRDCGIIDFTHFFNEFVNRLDGSEKIDWRKLHQEFLAIKSKCNLALLKSIDPDAYKPSGTFGTSISPLFLSIFFPYATSADMQTLLVSMYRDIKPITNTSYNWDDFVLLLFEES
jgi:hypothetical protein